MGVAKNAAQATNWWQKAAAQGSVSAKDKLINSSTAQ
ncbi:hypothetical protein [Psychromonas sp.]